jgi:hypothetical protein
MMETIRAIIRLHRIGRLLKHLDKAVRLAEKAGLEENIALKIDILKILVASRYIHISDEAKEHIKGIAA